MPSGVEREDETLQQMLAGGTGHRDFPLAVELQAPPASKEIFRPAYKDWNYGRVQSSTPHIHILPDRDQHFNSNVGLWASQHETAHEGNYLDRRK